MRSKTVSFTQVLVTLICLLIFCDIGLCRSVPEEAMTAEILQDESNRITVNLRFQKPELKACSDEIGHERLWIDIPGAVLTFEKDGPVLPEFTRLLAVPTGYKAEVRILNRQDIEYEIEPALARDYNRRQMRTIMNEPSIEVGDPVWIRWLRVVPVVIRPARYDAENHCLTSSENMTVQFEFIPDNQDPGNPPDPERYWSLAYEEFFESNLLNPEVLSRIPQGGKPVTRGSYLILTNDVLAQYTEGFAEWKRRKGFDVVVEPIYYDGISVDEVMNYIQEAYDTWDRPPEFVLIIGDVNAPGMQFPAYRIQNPERRDEWDVTDLPYVLLEGDDYFPDAFIGRISTDSPMSSVVRNVFTRLLSHEMAQNFDNPEAFHRATLFAGNFADGGQPIISPVETMRWLGERLRELEFDVEEFYYQGADDDVRHAGPIIESLNRPGGVNIIAYRGWADANGPHFPQFNIPDLVDLDNGPLLPVFTFFICNTGDFGNDNVNPCFGEHVIAMGSRNRPVGALSFFGPSDLHLHTRHNNSMLGGYYHALMYKNQRTLGPLTLSSKMEVWRGFPNRRAPEDYVEFVFHVYNTLGDPELNLYFDPPLTLDVDHPEILNHGNSYIECTVNQQGGNPIQRAIVTLRWGEDNQVSALTDNNGCALVPIQLSDEEEMEITAIAHQAAPYMSTIPIEQSEHDIGFDSVEVMNWVEDDRLLTGAPISLMVTLRNTGSVDAFGVNAVLSTSFDRVDFIENAATFGNIRAGESVVANNPFTIRIDREAPDGLEIPFLLQISDSEGREYGAMFRLRVCSPMISYVSHAFEAGILNPGESSELVLTVKNIGQHDTRGLRADIHTHDNSVIIEDRGAQFGEARVGEEITCAENGFSIMAQQDATPGRTVIIRMAFFDERNRRLNNEFFNITIGSPEVEDPLGPDVYGYYAYEDIDDRERYPAAPTFEWIELDPEYGGEGADHYRLQDDTTFVMNLPFPFRFYGEDYDIISICSNGWISFEETGMFNFRNWGMPSPLGPHTMIAPFWEDLVGENADGGRRALDIFTRYDEDEGRFIMEWSRVIARQRDREIRDVIQTFEAILFDPNIHVTPTGDGEILFQYLDVEIVNHFEWDYATVGIQDWDHFRGLELTFSGNYPTAIDTLRPERAIKITTVPPDTFLVVDKDNLVGPNEFQLFQPYPNPFNSSTSIKFALPKPVDISLNIFNLNGQRVLCVFEGLRKSGFHTISLNAIDLPSGLYYISLESASYSSTQKLLLIK